MGKHFALALQVPLYSSQKEKKKTRMFKGKFKIEHWGVLIFSALVLLVLSYFIQVNTFSTKGYEIKQMQKRVSSLRDEEKKLQIEAAQLQSFQNIKAEPETSSMVPVSKVVYIQNPNLSKR